MTMDAEHGRYLVRAGGREIPVYEARVSAYPFNRVWPGKQRDISQTEIAYFATFDADFSRPVLVEIEVRGATPRHVEIRPLRRQPEFSLDGQTIRFSVAGRAQYSIEVDGAHGALQLFANEPFSYEPKPDDLYFGPGEHDAGMICPKSDQTVVLAEGATVYGAFYLYHADNVRIIGRGILDSSPYARGEVIAKKTGENVPPFEVASRGQFVADGCANLTVEGIIFRDSMNWAFTTRNECRGVLIDNIKIVGQWRYNADGVDICCSEDVVLRDSFIRAFDDCFVARGGNAYSGTGPVRNILVERCVMWCDWGKALEVWAGDLPTRIEDVRFLDNDLIRLTHMALDITTWFGSADTQIRRIDYRDIYIDMDGEYPAPMLQQTDAHAYPFEISKDGPWLLRVDCTKIGRSLGNQAHEPTDDFSRFSLRYSDITLNNVVCSRGGLRAAVVGVAGLLRIDGVTLTDVSASELSVRGDAHRVMLT